MLSAFDSTYVKANSMTYEPYPSQQYGAPDPSQQYGPPAGYNPQPPQSKGLGIASMVVGILAVLLAFIPIIGVVSFVLGLVAIGLGIFAIIKRRGKGQGIAGIITGAAALVIAFVVTLLTSAFVSVVEDELQYSEDLFEMEPEELEELIEGTDETSDVGADSSEDGSRAPIDYSSLTIIGDEEALPKGERGEVSIVAISPSEFDATFPFIVHNDTDEAISRVEVSGRAVDADGETIGTGSSLATQPNVVLPGGYAFGYVYLDSSDRELPSGASIPEPRVDYSEEPDRFENRISLDIENFEELSNGDLTGDVVNPHDMDVGGPIGLDTVCLTADNEVSYDLTYADSDDIDAGDSTTWTLSSYREVPDCAVRLMTASGYDW